MDSHSGQILSGAIAQLLADAAKSTTNFVFDAMESFRSQGKRGTINPRDHFQSARALLKSRRTPLARLAWLHPDYDKGRIWPDVPVLAKSEWVMPLVLLPPPGESLDHNQARIYTRLIDNAAQSGPISNDSAGRQLAKTNYFGGLDQASPILTYVDAIKRVESPDTLYLEDRPSYRLRKIGANTAHRGRQLGFTVSGYFNYLDSSEVLGYEFAHLLVGGQAPCCDLSDFEQLGRYRRWLQESLPLRQSVPWLDLDARHAVAGVNNLLIIQSGAARRFLMMRRNAQVGTAGETIHVIPAGEFQPSSRNPEVVHTECTLWNTLFREFAEELLLMTKAQTHDADGHDFCRTQPFGAMYEFARGNGVNSDTWRTYFLGFCFDALSLKPELLLATVIEEKAFQTILRSNPDRPNPDATIPEQNAEGQIIRGKSLKGIDFTKENLRYYLSDQHTLPAGMACLRRALFHFDGLRL